MLSVANVYTCYVTFHPDIGYGYGYLLAREVAENYQALMKSLLGDKWYDEVRVCRETLAIIVCQFTWHRL